MERNIIFGQAMEDIQAGDAVILDSETGKFRKAIQVRWEEELKEGDKVVYLPTGESATVSLKEYLELEILLENGDKTWCLYEEIKPSN